MNDVREAIQADSVEKMQQVLSVHGVSIAQMCLPESLLKSKSHGFNAGEKTLDVCFDWEGNTPLLLAASSNALEVFKYLLSEGLCDEHAVNKKGLTVLDAAGQCKSDQIVMYILENGLQVGCSGHNGDASKYILSIARSKSKLALLADTADTVQ